MSDPAAILSYTFIDAFDTYTNDIAGISNNAIAINSNGSGLPGTHRGLYFDGSGSAKVEWQNDFILALQFSVHSWVYAFDQANRTSDMTLFSKTKTVDGAEEWYDHVALRVDTELNFKVNLGYNASATSYTSLTSSADALAQNTWTYVTYYLYMTNSNQVNVQMYINSAANGSIDTLTLNRIMLFDDPAYDACVGSEHLQSATYMNQWNGYIYDVHIYQALGDMHYKTIGCNEDCNHCPLNNDCLWAVDWENYDDGTCETTCDNIGCRRDGRCQDCSFQHCHMCADYYCEQCSDHSSDSCNSCLSAAVNGSNGSCVCGTDLWGNQFSRSDIEKPCCASGCDTCDDEVNYAHCSVCNSSYYEQPAVTATQAGFKVCFDECPTGFTATEGSPRTCAGEGRRIIDYDLTYIERDFANLAIDGQNVGQLADFWGSGFADTQPYKLRGAYGNGVNEGVFIPNLHLHHSFSVSFWAKLTGTNDQERVLFSKDKGGNYDTPNAENFLDVAVLNNGRLAAFMYLNADNKFNGDCQTAESAVLANAWYYIVYTFDFDGTNTIVTIYVDSVDIFSYTAQTIYIQDKSSYPNAWLFMSTASSNDEPAPANAWEGFIYRFQLDQYVITPTEIVAGIELVGTNCSPDTITCSKCPTVNGRQCLWPVNRDEYIDSDGNELECDDSNDHDEPLCLNDVGCCRREDCNRCHDRLCQTCVNFDEGVEICEECKTNTDNNSGTTVCQCNNQFFFDERSDNCEACNVACDECADFGDKTAKSCTACQTDYFLHPDSNTCLDFCPTGFTENGLVCVRGADATMLDLSLESWEQTFKIINAETIPVIRGSFVDYDDADPWLYRSVENYRMFYFDGSNDCMYIGEETIGNNYLRLFHTMTIEVWAYSFTTGQTQTLFAKIDKNASNGNQQKIYLDHTDTYLDFGFTEDFEGASSSVRATGTEDFTGQWFQVTVVMTSTGSHSSDIRIHRNAVNVGTKTVAEQFSDLKGADTRIGCDLTHSSWIHTKLFKGFLYSLEIESEAHTDNAISNDYGSGFAPSLGSCAYNQYVADAGCQSCNGVCNELDDSCTYDVDQCTVCEKALCIQCRSAGPNDCQLCKPGARLVNSTCVCDDGFYDGVGECIACHVACSLCTGGNRWNCQECASGNSLQPDDIDVCLPVCPLGYSDSGSGTCGTGSADTIAYNFDLITKTWISGNVTFDAGLSSSAESDTVEPYTYKLRGAFFSDQNLMSLRTTMYLHAKLSIDIWYLPFASSGSLFSKSYDNWTNSSSSAFLDIALSAGGVIQFGIQGTYTNFANCFTERSWAHIGLVADYDKFSVTTIVTPIRNGVVGSSTSVNNVIILEEENSTAAIGARYDGSSGNKTTTNYYNGYIWTINITPQLLSTTSIANDVLTTCTCGDPICPDELAGACLWECLIDQYYRESTQTCETCQTCDRGTGGYNEGWKGCAYENHCSLCDNRLCTECDSFNANTCSECVANADDPALNNADCQCDNFHFEQQPDYTCTCAVGCAQCTALDIYNCISCQAGWFLQDGVTWCLTECPTRFTSSGQRCVAPSQGNEQIIGFNFVSSFDVFSNQVTSLSSITATAVYTDATLGSANPVTWRGLYFTSSDAGGYVQIGTFMLNNSCSIHSWFLNLDSSRTENATLFSKDRDTANSNDFFCIELRPDASLDVSISFVDVTDLSDVESGNFNITMSSDTWYNGIATITTVNNRDTSVSFSVNSVFQGTLTIQDHVFEDSASYRGFIGAKRDNNLAFVDRFNGYIYDFQAYQNGGIDNYSSNHTHWVVEFSQYRDFYFEDGDVTTCDSTCTNNYLGCRRIGRCQSCLLGFNHCHMCYDYYCTNCSDHALGTCSSCENEYTYSSGGCTCKNDMYGRTYVRDDTLNPCCANGCNQCVDSLHYAYCRSCRAGFYEQPKLYDPHTNFEVCMQDCPSGYTTGENQVCVGSAELVINYDLTYIERTFDNLAIDNVLDGQLGSVRT